MSANWLATSRCLAFTDCCLLFACLLPVLAYGQSLCDRRNLLSINVGNYVHNTLMAQVDIVLVFAAAFVW